MVRFKNRYFLFRINGQAAANPITQHDFLYTLKNSLVIMLGNHGYALTLPSLSIKYFDAVSQVGILRVSRAEYRKVWACLSLLTCIVGPQGKNASISTFKAACSISILHISGTIRNCQLKAIRHLQREIPPSIINPQCSTHCQ